MIGFFPDPYPDELFYSACARYAQRLKYPNKQSAITELFGRRGLSAIVDFPTRLDHFLSRIPSHKYTADEIISENTLFPFFEPFTTTDRAKLIREEMKSSSDNHLNTRLAININQIKTPTFLRYCPTCIKDDRTRFGETFWHRLHQLAGIFVCPEHLCFLESSRIRWDRESSKFFHLAEDGVQVKNPHLLNKENTAHKVLLTIARNAKWLLKQSQLSLENGVLRERYYNILLRKGYAWYNGRIKSKELVKDFLDYFPCEVLEKNGCAMKIEEMTWLERMVKKNLADVFNHPVRHLLLLDFLSVGLDQFFRTFEEYKPFGYPPYPCLNVTADHYKKMIIWSCQINDNLSKKEELRLPVAVFNCDECGFIYRRLGPDKSPKDKFRYDSVVEYGNLWEQSLAERWRNLDLSASEVARRFGTTVHLITRHAIRLNLPMNTENTRKVEGYARHQNPRQYFSENQKKYRSEWLKIVEEDSKLNRKELNIKHNFIYLWLKRNDSEWFESHLPPPFIPERKKDYYDWKKIDKELAKKVKVVSVKILKENKPTRVCITEIIKRIGYKKWLEKRDEKLPLTSRILTNYLESLEDFMLRKLKVAEQLYIQEKKVPTRNQLIYRAVIVNSTSKKSLKIQKEVDATLGRITQQVS